MFRLPDARARKVVRKRAFWKEIAKDLSLVIIGGIISGIIVVHYGDDIRYILFPREPQLEITGIRYSQVPTETYWDLPSLEIERENKTLVTYRAASLPYISVEVRNVGEKVALIDKLNIEVLRWIYFQPAVTPTWNYTIKLQTWEIYSRLNFSQLNTSIWESGEFDPPLVMDFELTPHFKIESHDIDAFGVYIDTDFDIDTCCYLIKITINYDGKTVKTYPIWIKIIKPPLREDLDIN